MEKTPRTDVMEGVQRIAKRKLSDEVFERLKRLIVEGEKPPGSLMPSERELMTRFGVGRPAIREAMQQLEGMGLVAIHHGERARVLELTPEGLKALGNRTMQPGMPAEVLVKTGERSLLTYLLHPLLKRVASAMTEE
jgi:DNA-binding FadR family transcriptional regulator